MAEYGIDLGWWRRSLWLGRDQIEDICSSDNFASEKIA
jgi:hypothetical protein